MTRQQTTDEAALEALLPDAASRKAVDARATALMIRNALLQAIDNTRSASGISKKDLAQATELDYASLRRLLTSDNPNPTLDTLARLLAGTHLRLQLVTEGGEIISVDAPQLQPISA